MKCITGDCLGNNAHPDADPDCSDDGLITPHSTKHSYSEKK